MKKLFSNKKAGFTRTNFSSKNSRGFTLIELLVVIAIIGILSSVVLASLNSARTKARDTRRVADLKQIQIAMELYADANSGVYPTNLTTGLKCAATGCTGGQSLSTIPTDPKDQTTYKFGYAPASPTRYHLGANMEQDVGQTTLDSADIDANSTAWTGVVGGFDGADAAAPASWIYDVTN